MKKAIINKGMMKMDKEKMDTFFEGLIAIIFKEMLEMILPLQAKIQKELIILKDFIALF